MDGKTDETTETSRWENGITAEWRNGEKGNKQIEPERDEEPQPKKEFSLINEKAWKINNV